MGELEDEWKSWRVSGRDIRLVLGGKAVGAGAGGQAAGAGGQAAGTGLRDEAVMVST